MGDSRPSICIHCGQSTDETRRFNRLEDGRVCPICRDRLLEQLPPLLPTLSYADAEGPNVPMEPDAGPEGA